MKNCIWEPYENRFRCRNCGYIISQKIPRNCDIYHKKAPGLAQKTVNFTKAATNHVITCLKHCTEEEKQQRFNICKSNKCGLFREHGDGGICAHDDCGCYIRSSGKFMDKLSWADSKCPVGLWGPKSSENPENGV